jgi:methyltransferase family protein
MARAPLRSLVDAIQARSRRRKLERFLEVLRPDPSSRLLEVGVGDTERLPSTNFMVRRYPYPDRITALGVGPLRGFKERHPAIRTVRFDGRAFPFRDRAFDLVHSNAVIEHVGSTEAQESFLAELARISRSGMVSTPNKYFPLETHSLVPLLHWLRKERFDAALERIGVERISSAFRLIGREFPVEEMRDLRLLSAGDLARMARRLGLPGFRVLRNRLAGLTLTLSLVWQSADLRPERR